MPTFDYVPRLDPRNRNYRVAAPVENLNTRARWWTGGVILDQGQEGSCVGHGVVAEYLASPVRGRVPDPRPENGHELAVQVYDRARQIDEFEGDFTEGTSVRAGMLVGREHGWYDGFRWAFNLTDLRAALEQGPVVVGIDVREAMYDTDTVGDWHPDGPSVGGHCCLITGYSPNYKRRGPRYRIRNSWGPDWGDGGNAYIAPDDLNLILFRSGGEAAVPAGRHL